jgi:hypothetical protein
VNEPSPRSQPTVLGLCLVSVAAVLFGLVAPPADRLPPSVTAQLVMLFRLLLTGVLAFTLVIVPGLVWRRRPGGTLCELAFVPLPGLAFLVATGALAWLLAPTVEPRLTAATLVLPLLLCLTLIEHRGGPSVRFTGHDRKVLAVMALLVLLCGARALWSVGPVGELYAGTVSRTLEVGDRSDSRISFHVVQLVAHGYQPYSPEGRANFLPYNFSDRGPISGLAAVPIVLLSGGRPPVGLPDQPWRPFDREGFASYRLTMMVFAATAFLALETLVRRLASPRASWFALILAATTPFLVHEIWFTWPKLFTASLVLTAAVALLDNRMGTAGLLLATAYLVHPMALLSLPAFGLIALKPLHARSIDRTALRRVGSMGLAVFVGIAFWRVVNGSHFAQSNFLDYVTSALGHGPVTAARWASHRLESLANTLIPFRLVLWSSHDPAINAAGGASSPTVVHFFFQTWTTLPFGVGLAFFPMLLISLGRAARRWLWAILATVVAPFLAFALYWGSYSTGLLREGLHPWVLTLIAVCAIEQSNTARQWVRNRWQRALLTVRVLEVLAAVLAPALATQHRLIDSTYAVTDAVALSVMGVAGACLAGYAWRLPAPSVESREPAGSEAISIPAGRLTPISDKAGA